MSLNVDIQIVNYQHNQVLNYLQQLVQLMLCIGQMIQIGHLHQKVMVDTVCSFNRTRLALWRFLLTIGSIKPGDNTNIYIPRGTWLVVDYPLPTILLLRIDGVLEFEQVCLLFYH
jgi:hypothetical protein